MDRRGRGEGTFFPKNARAARNARNEDEKAYLRVVVVLPAHCPAGHCGHCGIGADTVSGEGIFAKPTVARHSAGRSGRCLTIPRIQTQPQGSVFRAGLRSCALSKQGRTNRDCARRWSGIELKRQRPDRKSGLCLKNVPIARLCDDESITECAQSCVPSRFQIFRKISL